MSQWRRRARLRRSERAPSLHVRQSAAQAGARSSGTHRALHVPLVVATLLVGALVVELFPFAEREGDLGFSTLEVDLEREQGQALTLDGADHLADLLLVQEELPRPCGLVIEVARLFIRRYVQIEQKDFSVFYDRVGIGDVGLPVTQRLDLAAGQNNPRLPGVEDVVVVSGAFVPRHRLLLILVVFLCHLTSWSSETQLRALQRYNGIRRPAEV